MKTEYRAYKQWLGVRLRELRDSKKISQAQVAIKISIKRSAYASYEEGRAEPAMPILKRFCKFYNLTISEFLQGSPEPEMYNNLIPAS